MPRKQLGWDCPECNHNSLLECANATVKMKVLGIENGFAVVGQAVELDTRRYVVHYECAACGYLVKNGPVVISNPKELADWLERR